MIHCEPLSLKTSLSSKVIHRALFRGSFLAILGVSGIVLAGMFVPAPILGKFGWLAFPICLGLIGWGLIPYRRLCRLEIKPDELREDGSDSLVYLSKGKPVLTIPKKAIIQCDFIEEKNCYGIALQLNKSQPAKIFLPYFSRRSFQVLLNWIKKG